MSAGRKDVNTVEKQEHGKEHALSETFSHQIRNPLTAITGYLSLLREGAFGTLSAEQQEILQVISKNVRRVNMLLDNFKDVECIEDNTLTLTRCLIRVEEVLEPIIRDFSSLAGEKGIRLTIEMEKDITIFADIEIMRRVFLHLILNSINYTQSGEVGVKTYSDGHRTVILVEDTGIGFDEVVKSNAFTKYYRSSSPYVRENPGAGLGLYIAQAHVIAHGGSIEIESTPGKGSVTTVRLPAIPPDHKNGDRCN